MSWCMEGVNPMSDANGDGGKGHFHFQVQPGCKQTRQSHSHAVASRGLKYKRKANLGKSILIVGKSNDLLSKTQHSSCATARGLERPEGDAKAICALRRDCSCSQTWASRVGRFRFL